MSDLSDGDVPNDQPQENILTDYETEGEETLEQTQISTLHRMKRAESLLSSLDDRISRRSSSTRLSSPSSAATHWRIEQREVTPSGETNSGTTLGNLESFCALSDIDEVDKHGILLSSPVGSLRSLSRLGCPEYSWDEEDVLSELNDVKPDFRWTQDQWVSDDEDSLSDVYL